MLKGPLGLKLNIKSCLSCYLTVAWSLFSQDNQWYQSKNERKREKDNTSNKVCLIKRQKPSSPSVSHMQKQPLIFFQSGVNVKWQSNDFWVFPCFRSLVRVTQRLTSCSSVSQTKHKHRQSFGSFVPLAWLLLEKQSCYTSSVSVYPAKHRWEVLLMFHSRNKFVFKLQTPECLSNDYKQLLVQKPLENRVKLNCLPTTYLWWMEQMCNRLGEEV